MTAFVVRRPLAAWLAWTVTAAVSLSAWTFLLVTVFAGGS